MRSKYTHEQIGEMVSLTSEKIALMPYEEAMERFEKVVDALEQEGTPLALGLKLYETGTALSQRCGSILDTTEERMVQLLSTAHGIKETLFDPEKDGR